MWGKIIIEKEVVNLNEEVIYLFWISYSRHPYFIWCMIKVNLSSFILINHPLTTTVNSYSLPLPLPFSLNNYIVSHQEMATKLLTFPVSHRCMLSSRDQIQAWPGRCQMPTRQISVVSRLSTSLNEALLSTSDYVDHLPQQTQSLFLLAESSGYSLASYYTSLGLFIISVPGLWSLIKRSVKSKVLLVFCSLLTSFNELHI